MNAVVFMDVLTSAKTYQGHTGAYVMLDILYKLMKGSVEVCILYYNNIFCLNKSATFAPNLISRCIAA